MFTLVLCVKVAVAVSAAAAEPEAGRRGAPLFFRAVGAETNAPVLPRTRSAWTQDRQERTGTTGMSRHGFTEYPHCSGAMDFTFVQSSAYYPRIVSGAPADPGTVNTADIVLDHVYEPDGCVWGFSGREFVQTFTATRNELVSVTLLVASPAGTFRASLHEGGPGGRQVGPARTFASGHSMTWGTAVWEAGQAPLESGRTYGLRICRSDGKPWTPYLHATGDAYAGGLLHVDGVPHPESDMAAWIVEEPPDLIRAVVPDADNEGWVYRAKAVAMVPRSENIRLLSVDVAPLTEEDLRAGHCDMVATVCSEEGEVVGGPKRCLSVGHAGGTATAHFLFAAEELRVRPGRRQTVRLAFVPHSRPDLPAPERIAAGPRDVRLRAYGEPEPGALPATTNLRAECETDSRLRLAWSQTTPASTRIVFSGLGVNDGLEVNLPPGETDVALGKFWAGHEYDFRLTSTGPKGLMWRTPLYRVRMPRKDEIGPLVQAEYPEAFVTLAPPRYSAAPEYGPLRYRRQVEIRNHEFEKGLVGWRPDGRDPIGAVPSEHDVGVKWGKQMAGWTVLGGDRREQVFAEGTLTQTVPSTPGHVYVMSAWAYTSVQGGPRGDVRVRLMADPAGGQDFGWNHSSQWYWTDGRWMRFQHGWRAEADRATVGLGFFRWSDQDRSSAYIDHVTVYDLGPAPAGPADGTCLCGPDAGLVMADPKDEATDRVEAHAAAPPGCVITGVGSRAHYDNVTTLWLRVQPLLADGTLGEPEQVRAGWEPDAGLEAAVELPPGYVATGFGARAAPEWDVKSLVVWARPLNPDGSLGEERAFRGGVEPEKGPERHVQLQAGRVLISAGLNCMHNDINGIRARSAAVVRPVSASQD
jgi:hypothetical protein